MTDFCSTTPWPTACLDALLDILVSGDRERLASWVGNHIDGSDVGWTSYVIALASLGSGPQQRALDIAASLGGEVIVAPGNDPDLPQAARDVELVVSALLNGDMPGVAGAVDGIRDRDGFDEFLDALVLFAVTMLQFEALTQGGAS